MKKYSVIWVIFCHMVFNHSLCAQNLVVNPSFENVNTGSLQCMMYGAGQFNPAINNWTNPTDATPDIHHNSLAVTCVCHPLSSSGGAIGNQSPRTGSSDIGTILYGSNAGADYREYLQGALTTPLMPGTQYYVQLHVSLGDNVRYACNNLGIYFSTSFWYSSISGVYSATPQLENTAVISDKTSWTLVSFTFTPVDAYTHFTIGNFRSNGSTTRTDLGSGMSMAYYYIEDIYISSAPPLPVSLIDFDAYYKNGNVINEWSTASETNCNYFTIERSSDMQNFEPVGTIKGAGNSNTVHTYSFIDDNPIPGVSYYRLKQTDYNGDTEYFPAKSIRSENISTESIKVFPNPVQDFITIACTEIEDAEVIITNIIGNTVFRKYVSDFPYELQTCFLEKGLYYVSVISSNRIKQGCFIKN
ncbi:MAG: T9SS type A sorting domain-containing protein [Bacteroidota bacterium]